MILRLGLLSICLFVVACSDSTKDAADTNKNGDTQRSALERLISVRIANCIEKGATEKNCACRANTSARFLSFGDFEQETRLLLSNDVMGLDEFQRRMFAEQRNTMMALGAALAECPVMRIRAE